MRQRFGRSVKKFNHLTSIFLISQVQWGGGDMQFVLFYKFCKLEEKNVKIFQLQMLSPVKKYLKNETKTSEYCIMFIIFAQSKRRKNHPENLHHGILC